MKFSADTAGGIPQSSRRELRFKGITISPGLASGPVWVVGDILNCRGDSYSIQANEVDAELQRIKTAFAQVEAELEESARRVAEELSPALAEIFRAHRLMLQSLLASNDFEHELQTSLITAEAAVRKIFRKWEAKFTAIEDGTVRQNADDILDLARRV